jgi:hypothetical protein
MWASAAATHRKVMRATHSSDLWKAGKSSTRVVLCALGTDTTFLKNA